MSSSLMSGKRGLIMGVANNMSLAWGVAKELHSHGAELAFTYAVDAVKKRVEPLAAEVDSDIVLLCDVSNEDNIRDVFAELKQKWGTIDFVLHAIGFSDKNELKGEYVQTSKANFLNTMDVSCFSFTSVCKYAQEIMNDGGSLLTLTYFGAQKVMPHYNVMGVAKAALESSVRYLAVDLGGRNIRVNALSAGPVKTLAASGIGDFRYILNWNQFNSPLKRNITTEDVGKSGLYLLSGLSSGVTGETHYVDCGYNIIGMKAIDAPDISLVNED
jgi:enoyl-[acyl-carrier protein] reductase I